MKAQVRSLHLSSQAHQILNRVNVISDETDELPLDATENVASLTSGDVMDGNTQMAILNRMAKLEAKFEKFMRQFEQLDGSSSSEIITGTDERRTFQPIDSIEKLDEFEKNLNDPEFENKTVRTASASTGFES